MSIASVSLSITVNYTRCHATSLKSRISKDTHLISYLVILSELNWTGSAAEDTKYRMHCTVILVLVLYIM